MFNWVKVAPTSTFVSQSEISTRLLLVGKNFSVPDVVETFIALPSFCPFGMPNKRPNKLPVANAAKAKRPPDPNVSKKEDALATEEARPPAKIRSSRMPTQTNTPAI